MPYTQCYGYGKFKSHRRRTIICATLFGTLLVSIMTLSIFLAYSSHGPFILGTEMNANGLVEYMCLGDGCNNMTPFQWKDS